MSMLNDIFWKLKWKIIHAARRRGIEISAGVRSSVPTACITGSVGKTTTTRMVYAILAAQGKVVALATTQGTIIGKQVIRSGDSSGGEHARQLLKNPQVEYGVFEMARGGLISDGLVLDSCTVGAVLNVFDNHLGLSEVRSRDDLARVKKTVVQHAKKMAVLNADDPLCLAMRDHVRAERLCMVSMRHDNPAVAEHISKKGIAVVLDGSSPEALILIQDGAENVGSMSIAEIPATFGGTYRPAVNNALFATAIATGLGVSCDAIWEGLQCFTSSSEDNPGRMNFLSGLPFEVLQTWADGPQAVWEIARFVGLRSDVRSKHIMFCGMGNRPDWFLRDMAFAVSGVFDSYICSDWASLRGRAPLETANLLADSLLKRRVPTDAVTVAPSHDDALRMALERPRPGDLLVLVTFSGPRAREIFEEFRCGKSGQQTSTENR